MASQFKYDPEGPRVGPPTHNQTYGTAAVDFSVGRGAKGMAVKELQAKLARLGFRLAQTGEFDADTEKTLKQLQTLAKIPVTGIYGARESTIIDSKMRQVLGDLGAEITYGDMISGKAVQMIAEEELAKKTGAAGAGANSNALSFSQLPTWQKGLMVAGGFALVGALYWLLNGRTFGNARHTVSGLGPKCSRVPDANLLESAPLLPAPTGA